MMALFGSDARLVLQAIALHGGLRFRDRSIRQDHRPADGERDAIHARQRFKLNRMPFRLCDAGAEVMMP